MEAHLLNITSLRAGSSGTRSEEPGCDRKGEESSRKVHRREEQRNT